MLDERVLIAMVVMSFLIRLFGPWIKIMLRYSAQRSRARTLLAVLRLREEVMRRKGAARTGGGALSSQTRGSLGIEDE
jgi:hypothetical protein